MPSLPTGVSARRVTTDRIELNVLESGAADGMPVVLVHGNVSSARFWAETMASLPDRLRVVAPDLRGFGESEAAPVDATRGVRDYSEDLAALVDEMGFDAVALVGWSLGGGVVMRYLIDHPDGVSHLCLVNPVAPHGFGGTDADGSPCQPDHAGTGGGLADDEFVERLAAGDTSADAESSPRNVLRAFYVGEGHEFDPDLEDAYTEAMCSTVVGDDHYPGDATESANWPWVAPGERGVLNAISPKYFDCSDLPSVDPKPPVAWLRGSEDMIVSDTSFFDAGYLGQLGEIPDWPGEEVFPPQPMVSQTRDILDAYAEAGVSYTETVVDGAGHSPHVERPDRVEAVLVEFLVA